MKINPTPEKAAEAERSVTAKVFEAVNYKMSLRIIFSFLILAFIHYAVAIPFPIMHMSQFGLLWACTTSVIVMQNNVGDSYKMALKRIYGVGIGCLISLLFLGLNGYGIITTMISIICTVALCSSLNLKESVRIAAVTTLTLTLNNSRLLTLDLPYYFVCLMRFGETIMGILVGLLISMMLFPEYALEKLQKNVVKIINRLKGLFQIMSWYHASAIKLDADDAVKKNIKEMYALFDSNINDMKAIQTELSFSGNPRNDLVLLLDHLETILHCFNQLYRVYKKPLFAELTREPQDKIHKVFELVEAKFTNLSYLLQNPSSIHDHVDETAVLESLHGQFNAYQEQRRLTLKAEEEESLFIFLFNMKQVVAELNKIEKYVKANKVLGH